jgi:hypothetical protein
MFNFNSVVDQVSKASKQSLSLVEDKKVRGSLETLIDTTSEFTITLYETNLELAKQIVENTKSVDFTKFFTAAK